MMRFQKYPSFRIKAKEKELKNKEMGRGIQARENKKIFKRRWKSTILNVSC